MRASSITDYNTVMAKFFDRFSPDIARHSNEKEAIFDEMPVQFSFIRIEVVGSWVEARWLTNL